MKKRSEEIQTPSSFIVNGKHIIAIHINWLINRYNDLARQLSKAKDESMSEESELIKKELKYLQGHSEVDQSLKDIIAEYLKDIEEKADNLDKPKPEGYFLRAELCRQCLRYDDALEDYFYGLDCLCRDNSLNIADFRIYFDGILESIRYSQKIQGTRLTNVTDDDNWASKISFAYGFSAFWDGKYNEAIVLFSDAIIQNNNVPIYWYYRALSWKRLGVISKANLDASKGALVEKTVFGKNTAVVGFLLQRIQGDERKWLENKRIGYK